MFKAPDFKLIQRDCPEELKKLLNLLNLRMEDFKGGDEFEIYSKLDKAIDKKFCERLHCKSDLDGYAKLLDLGGIEFDSGETRNNMLKKVLANRDKILGRTTNHTKTFKLTCNYTEEAFDLKNKSLADVLSDAVKKIIDVVKNKDISRLLPIGKEEILEEQVASEIKKVLVQHFDLSTCDEVVISIIGKNSAPRDNLSVPNVRKPDDKTFEILEQIDKIFDKI
ncbi:MAG: hypothetical protein SR1Q5_04760 [Quinella sp. 1Q5]|nr:hypothetical protein [Quinella sp. 1Q5]